MLTRSQSSRQTRILDRQNYIRRYQTVNTKMRKNENHNSRFVLKIIAVLALLAALGLLFMLGCSQEKENGTVLILELENSENVHQYWVFNPYIKTIEKCNAAANQAIAEILASRCGPDGFQSHQLALFIYPARK